MSNISKHFIKIDNKEQLSPIRTVEFIYLINLDKRPERLQRCMRQFAPYGIKPHRVAGIDGWSLSQEVFSDVTMKVAPSMQYVGNVQFRFVHERTEGEPFDESAYGRHCIHSGFLAGGMGCTLTHLSIVHDAWHAGYQTIWVLEDDITVKDDPRLLADFVDKLDSYTEWDVLYTDCEDLFSPKNVNIHYGGRTWMRPDRPITKALSEWALVGEDFLKIAGRSQAHSYLLRRSGMQKILEFVMSQGLFLPFDFELASVPDIRLYNLRHDIVHGKERDSSDTYKSN